MCLSSKSLGTEIPSISANRNIYSKNNIKTNDSKVELTISNPYKNDSELPIILYIPVCDNVANIGIIKIITDKYLISFFFFSFWCIYLIK